MPAEARSHQTHPLAIVVGGSEKVWEEYAGAKEIAAGLPLIIFAVNDMIGALPDPIDHAVTLHPAKIQIWLAERRRDGYPMPLRVWAQPPMAHYVRHRIQRNFADVTDQTTEEWGLSSGTFAIKIARQLGFERIVLCGVPLERNAGHFRRHRDWVWAPTPRTALKPVVPQLKTYVRSMSGWTMQQFGYPDRNWLEGQLH